MEDFVSKVGGAIVAAWPVVLAAAIGYVVGAAKFFKEHQLKMYGEALPELLKGTFDPKNADEKFFNQSLSKIWLYASRDVALKVDVALSRAVDPSRGSFMDAMQSAIVAMRKDIQPWWRIRKRRMNENDVNHFQFSFPKQENIQGK